MKFYNASRNFGFIAMADGQEIYFNKAALPRERRYDPCEGDTITCEIRDARQGKIAHRIEIAE